MIGFWLVNCEIVKKILDNINIEVLNFNFLFLFFYVYIRSIVVVVMLVCFDIFKIKYIFD